jgi:hypothetical protein
MQKLDVVEKPNVVQDRAHTIGDSRNTETVFENDEFIISSTIGAIVRRLLTEDFIEISNETS